MMVIITVIVLIVIVIVRRQEGSKMERGGEKSKQIGQKGTGDNK